MTEAELSRMRTTLAILNSLPRPDATDLLDEVYRLRNLIDRALAAGHCTPCPCSDPGEVLVYHCESTHADLLARAAEIERLRAALAPLHDQLKRFLTASTEYARCGLFLDGTEAEALARAALAPPADESNR